LFAHFHIERKPTIGLETFAFVLPYRFINIGKLIEFTIP